MIKSIDLWTEQHENHYECFNGAFIDGFENGKFPFDEFKIVKNYNCLISSNKNIPISNKHNAIVFYMKSKPVRLLVANEKTNMEICVNNALSQQVKSLGGGTKSLLEIVNSGRIRLTVAEMFEKPIDNIYKDLEEIDVGSCDRLALLKTMLNGSYTEDKTQFGNFDNNIYIFDESIKIIYFLKTDSETFKIEHKGAFYNTLKTRIIPIQKNGTILKNDLNALIF